MFCSFQFYLCLTSPFKPCCEIKKLIGNNARRSRSQTKRLLTAKTKECDRSKSITSLFSLPFAAYIEIVYMIYNRLNKFSSPAIQSLITRRTSVLLGALSFQLGFHNRYSKKWCLCLHDQSFQPGLNVNFEIRSDQLLRSSFTSQCFSDLIYFVYSQ